MNNSKWCVLVFALSCILNKATQQQLMSVPGIITLPKGPLGIVADYLESDDYSLVHTINGVTSFTLSPHGNFIACQLKQCGRKGIWARHLCIFNLLTKQKKNLIGESDLLGSPCIQALSSLRFSQSSALLQVKKILRPRRNCFSRIEKKSIHSQVFKSTSGKVTPIFSLPNQYISTVPYIVIKGQYKKGEINIEGGDYDTLSRLALNWRREGKFPAKEKTVEALFNKENGTLVTASPRGTVRVWKKLPTKKDFLALVETMNCKNKKN